MQDQKTRPRKTRREVIYDDSVANTEREELADYVDMEVVELQDRYARETEREDPENY